MPFTSQAQRGFMYARHPEIAKRWEKETPKEKLPQYANGPKKSGYDGVKRFLSGHKGELRKAG